MNRAVGVPGEREHSARSVRHFAGRLFCGTQSDLVVAVRINTLSGSRQNAANSGQDARAPLSQNLRQKLSGMRVLGLRDLFRRSGGDDFAAHITSFWAEIDDPIGALNHLQIVLDHYERMPAIHKALE